MQELTLEQQRKLQFRPGVAVFALNHINEFPMGRRKSTKHDDGLWCLPGGGLEWGERFDECTVRETKEECGLNVTYGGQICSHTYYNAEADAYHLTVYTLATLDASKSHELNNAEPEKFYEWKWFTLDNMPSEEELAFRCTVAGASRLGQIIEYPWLLIKPEWLGE